MQRHLPANFLKMDTQKKPCLKCLLRELDEEAYMKQLHRYIVQLDPEVKTAQQVYEKRLELCKACYYLEAGTCLACGCYVELRAAVKKNRCPYRRWEK